MRLTPLQEQEIRAENYRRRLKHLPSLREQANLTKQRKKQSKPEERQIRQMNRD